MFANPDSTPQPDPQPAATTDALADTASTPNVGCVPGAPRTLNIDASSADVPSTIPETSASPLEQAIERGDMAAAIAALAPAVELLPYQLDAVAAEDRFTWSCWSRQVGKSFTFSLRRLLRGLIRRRNQIFLSAGERQSREVMEKVRMHCRALRIWHEIRGLPFYRDATIKQLEARLPGGGGDVRREGSRVSVYMQESVDGDSGLPKRQSRPRPARTNCQFVQPPSGEFLGRHRLNQVSNSNYRNDRRRRSRGTSDAHLAACRD